MDKNINSFKQGDIVAVSDKIYGSYIGKFIEKHKLLPDAVKVQILACTCYPSQRTILPPTTIYERRPYEYGSINVFAANGVEAYSGTIPSYSESVRVALEKAIALARQQGDVDIAAKLRIHLLNIA